LKHPIRDTTEGVSFSEQRLQQTGQCLTDSVLWGSGLVGEYHPSWFARTSRERSKKCY